MNSAQLLQNWGSRNSLFAVLGNMSPKMARLADGTPAVSKDVMLTSIYALIFLSIAVRKRR